ncbi:MAG: zinc ribbon domain-containing protein [Pyrinomonadaceae bacterium]
MVEAILEKTVCEKCGVDIREHTQFCYNCGNSVMTGPDVDPTPIADSNGSQVPAETQAALDELAKKFKIDEDADAKMAKAAAERRKARVSSRKSNEFVWEPRDEESGRLVFLLALLITVIAAAIVFIAVFWR